MGNLILIKLHDWDWGRVASCVVAGAWLCVLSCVWLGVVAAVLVR